MSELKPRFGATPSGANNHFPPDWEDRVVVGKHGTPTPETKKLFAAQARAEGGAAVWNPLNCTLWVQNFTTLPNYNSIPVRNYSAPDAGVCAIVLTLTTRNADGKLVYGRLVDQIQHATDGRSALQMLEAAWEDYKTWEGSSSNAYPTLIRQILEGV